ncbi:MAG TPA: glycosyltransferase family 39 protein [Bryobacteraceae bacterium]
MKQALLIVALVLAVRLPFLHQAIQGDEVDYLYGAEHAQIEPLHPYHTSYVFKGNVVDMRGHPHPPLNTWILGALLAAVGDIREAPFHLGYIAFSLIAALSMLALARRFSQRPLLATLLFCAVPAFVINGGSLEADLPLLAFWMATMALFIAAVDRRAYSLLVASAVCAAFAGLAAYQAVFLVPILALYLWQNRPEWKPAWLATLAAPAALATWQLFERLTSGAVPAAMLAGYLTSYHFSGLLQNLRGAATLLVHLAWSVCPLAIFPVLPQAKPWQWMVAIVAGLGAAIYDHNPFFWISFALGVWLLAWSWDQGFLGRWILIFFALGTLVFFAGSARYLLPLAAPVAILLANAAPQRILIPAFALQLGLGLTLAEVNAQHWQAYRDFAAAFPKDHHRIWVSGEWGLRFYLESIGALPLRNDQQVQPGDTIVSEALASPPPLPGSTATVGETEVRPSIPLRIVSLTGRSAYSTGSTGMLPFEIATAPIDRITTALVIEPKLSYLDPKNPAAAAQFVRGLYPDGWTSDEASVILKVPESALTLEASFWKAPNAQARHVILSANGRRLAERDIPAPGTYTISVPAPAAGASINVALSVDKTFEAPGDARSLGIVVTGIGYR